MGVKKLPKGQRPASRVCKAAGGKRKDLSAEYRRSREEMQELLTAKANVDRLLNMDEETEKEQEKTTASGEPVMVQSVRRHWTSGDVRLVPTGVERRPRSHRMKFCVQRAWGAALASKQRGKSQRDFLLCGPCVLTQALLASLHGCMRCCPLSVRYFFLDQLQQIPLDLGISQSGNGNRRCPKSAPLQTAAGRQYTACSQDSPAAVGKTLPAISFSSPVNIICSSRPGPTQTNSVRLSRLLAYRMVIGIECTPFDCRWKRYAPAGGLFHQQIADKPRRVHIHLQNAALRPQVSGWVYSIGIVLMYHFQLAADQPPADGKTVDGPKLVLPASHRNLAADLRHRFAQRDGVIFFRPHPPPLPSKPLEMFPYRAAAKEHWLAGAEVDATVRAEIVKPPFQIPRVMGVEQLFVSAVISSN